MARLRAVARTQGNQTAGFVSKFLIIFACQLIFTPASIGAHEECRLTPVFHVLQAPGCNSMTIPSFACVGKCTSYVQVSASKMWQIERSCMCCQESGEREATVTLSCPKASGSKIHKVVTKAPVDCMCRPCTGVDEGAVLPQDMAGYLESGDSLSPAFSVFPVRIQM